MKRLPNEKHRTLRACMCGSNLIFHLLLFIADFYFDISLRSEFIILHSGRFYHLYSAKIYVHRLECLVVYVTIAYIICTNTYIFVIFYRFCYVFIVYKHKDSIDISYTFIDLYPKWRSETRHISSSYHKRNGTQNNGMGSKECGQTGIRASSIEWSSFRLAHKWKWMNPNSNPNSNPNANTHAIGYKNHAFKLNTITAQCSYVE